jgi:hypothetical protein
MIRKLFSSRQPILLDVFGNRPGERKFADVAATQEKTDRKEVLGGKFATARWITICQAVNQARESGVRSLK